MEIVAQVCPGLQPSLFRVRQAQKNCRTFRSGRIGFVDRLHDKLEHGECGIDGQQQNTLPAGQLAADEAGHGQNEHDGKHHRDVHKQRSIHAVERLLGRDGERRNPDFAT